MAFNEVYEIEIQGFVFRLFDRYVWCVGENVDIDVPGNFLPSAFSGTVAHKSGSDAFPEGLSLNAEGKIRGTVSQVTSGPYVRPVLTATQGGVTIESADILMAVVDYGDWSPTITNLETGETFDMVTGKYWQIGDGVHFKGQARVRKSSEWTTMNPRLSLPVADANPSDFIGGGQGYGGSEQKFVVDDNALEVEEFDVTGFGVGETSSRALAWDGNDLWMVGAIRDRLIRLDRTTGMGTELGNSGFGVGETIPTALAWDGNDLWMVGTTRDRLIRLDRTTGMGTELGDAGFGVGETAPTALAWDGNDLWMVGAIRDRLIRLDRTTGMGTELGNSGFGVGETSSRALAWDGNDLWMVGAIRDRLIRLDHTTGMGTELGNSGFGVGETIPTALAWDGNDLWMVGTTRDRLIRLDRTTGMGTELGDAGFGVGETAPTALAWDGNDLWMVGAIRDRLTRLIVGAIQSVDFRGDNYTTAIAQIVEASNLIELQIEKLQMNDGDAFINFSGSYEV